MKPLEIIAFIAMAAIFLFLVLYFWYIALIFVVVGLFSTLKDKYRNYLLVKIAFVALYFVAVVFILSLFRSHGIVIVPNISNLDGCANGYVCY